MEKAVVFGPLIMFFGFFVLAIIFFVGFIVKLALKSKNEEWSGTVIDKKVSEIDSEDSGPRDYYYLVVKMDTGKERNIGLSAQLWGDFKIGDKLHKAAGKLFPDKI